MGRKILNNREMALFCEQMGMIIAAGISPMEGAAIMLEDTENKEGRAILQIISEKCDEGVSFYKSVQATEVFPKYALDMLEIGEKSGNLEEVLKSLAFHYNREENISSNIKSAVTYPFIIIAMMLAVILVLVVKVLPIFNDVFIQLGSGLTGFSRSLMNFGTALGNNSFWIILLIGLVLVFYLLGSKTEKGRTLLIKSLGIFAGGSRLTEAISSGRFAAGMALTLSAGLDTEESLELVGKMVDNPKMQKKIAVCRDLLKEGQTFANALFKAGIFSNIYTRMILVGSKTGSLETVLENIAEGYEDQVNERMNRLISVLEPTLVIIMSLVVCLILLSVMLPLMAIMTSIM